jgi:hypothetical protein
MTKPLTTLRTFGNKTWDNTIDFLIYIPHSSVDTDWISFARSTFQWARDDISDVLLGSYIYHEADIGMHEVALSCVKSLGDTTFSVGILEVDIPRALCDMNRPFWRAIPPIMNGELWRQIYDDATSEISAVLSQSRFCLQLHSMCSYDCILPLRLDTGTSVAEIQTFLSTGYSGKARECTLLTSDTQGNYKSNHDYDTLLIQSFEQANIPLELNTAYQLMSDYPATAIMENMPSSLLEITKWALATSNTSHIIDTNSILFDPQKIDFFGEMLARSIWFYAVGSDWIDDVPFMKRFK